MKDIEKLPVNEKIKLFSEITKLKKHLQKYKKKTKFHQFNWEYH